MRRYLLLIPLFRSDVEIADVLQSIIIQSEYKYVVYFELNNYVCMEKHVMITTLHALS